MKFRASVTFRPGFYAALTCLLAIGSASAFEARSGNEIIVAPNETVMGDLYATGGRIVIQGRVAGDVFAAGNTVSVTGTVAGDLTATGLSVSVSGRVEDDIRAAAYAVNLAGGARVGGDVVASGFSLDTAPSTRVDGDLVFGGRQARLAGQIAGSARTGVAGLELGGAVGGTLAAAVAAGGDITARVSPSSFGMPPVPAVAVGLAVAEGARVGGNLNLTAPAELSVRQGVVAGEIATRVRAAPGPPFYLTLLNYAVVLLVAGLLLFWLTPGSLQRGANALSGRPLASLGWGVLGAVGVPVVLTILLSLVVLLVALLSSVALSGLTGLIGVVGITAVVVLALLFVLALWVVAPIVAGYGLGSLVVRSPERSSARPLALAAGVLLVALLAAVPVVGGVIELLLVLFGFGALVVAWRGRRRAVRARNLANYERSAS